MLDFLRAWLLILRVVVGSEVEQKKVFTTLAIAEARFPRAFL
jgi:hypothetical protein